MPINRVEELFRGLTDELAYIVVCLNSKGRTQEAAGIYIRNKLKVQDFPAKNQGVAKNIDNLKYKPEKDY